MLVDSGDLDVIDAELEQEFANLSHEALDLIESHAAHMMMPSLDYMAETFTNGVKRVRERNAVYIERSMYTAFLSRTRLTPFVKVSAM